ncbi:aldo/keto reductase [Frigidibacter sp. ROC022]|uniref:aldo/keto reductase n=1 Tax=Frigidibacter sp. ROC022 TaxID=2971796 RepID=UPI00215A10F5|nr:aldo/keto reductase [Frigidibacter sp. ROC022]MCR8723694.1 aldo/keto reductase [Frigidibacter sp. ROC022]
MRTRKFGPNGPDLPALGYGAMSLGNAWGDVDDSGADAMLSALADRGIRHLDTANVYGQGLSESRIGAWIARNGNPFHIATKATISRDSEGNRTFNNAPEHLMSELEGSLKRLNVEAVDVFYAHRRNPGTPVEELAETLQGIVRSGKAKAVGLSEVAPTTLLTAAEIQPIAAVQSEYSLQTRAPDLGLRQACERLGTALVAFSPVGRGLLTDTPPTPEFAAANFFMKDNPRFQPEALARNIAYLAPLRSYAADLGLSLAGLAVAWTLEQGPTMFSIPGTRSIAHLDQMIEGARRGLTADELDEIERLAPVGWCLGDRYSYQQWWGAERYS